MRGMRALWILWAALLATGCATLEVRSAASPARDLGELESWRWAPLPPTLIGDISPTDAGVLDARVRRALEAGLAARGYRRTDGRPDFFVYYSLAVDAPVHLERVYRENPVYASWGRWARVPEPFADVDALPPGTLVVDALDAAGVLLWRGAAQSTAHEAASAEEREGRARETAAGILEHFPPRTR